MRHVVAAGIVLLFLAVLYFCFFLFDSWLPVTGEIKMHLTRGEYVSGGGSLQGKMSESPPCSICLMSLLGGVDLKALITRRDGGGRDWTNDCCLSVCLSRALTLTLQHFYTETWQMSTTVKSSQTSIFVLPPAISNLVLLSDGIALVKQPSSILFRSAKLRRRSLFDGFCRSFLRRTFVTSLCSDVIKRSPNAVSTGYAPVAELIQIQLNRKKWVTCFFACKQLVRGRYMKSGTAMVEPVITQSRVRSYYITERRGGNAYRSDAWNAKRTCTDTSDKEYTAEPKKTSGINRVLAREARNTGEKTRY